MMGRHRCEDPGRRLYWSEVRQCTDRIQAATFGLVFPLVRLSRHIPNWAVYSGRVSRGTTRAIKLLKTQYSHMELPWSMYMQACPRSRYLSERILTQLSVSFAASQFEPRLGCVDSQEDWLGSRSWDVGVRRTRELV